MSRESSYDQKRSASTSTTQEPTDAQRAWVARLEKLLGELEELEREGRRLRAARLDAPEAVLLRFVAQQNRGALALMQVAREQDRRLIIVRGAEGPMLDIGPPVNNVVSLADRRK